MFLVMTHLLIRDSNSSPRQRANVLHVEPQSRVELNMLPVVQSTFPYSCKVKQNQPAIEALKKSIDIFRYHPFLSGYTETRHNCHFALVFVENYL